MANCENGLCDCSLEEIRLLLDETEAKIMRRCARSNSAVERCLRGQGAMGKVKFLLNKLGGVVFGRHSWCPDYCTGHTNEWSRIRDLRVRINELMGIGIEKMKEARSKSD